MNNPIGSTGVQTHSDVAAQCALGRALASAYCAAQGVSLHVSDHICAAVEEAPKWAKVAFNLAMKDTPFNVRAEL